MDPPAPLTFGELVQRWEQLADRARKGGLLLVAQAFAGAKPLELTAGALTIEAAAEHVRGNVFGGEFAEPVSRLLTEVAGRPLRLVVKERAGGPSVAARAGETPADAEARARRYQEAQQHPLVKELLRRFEADIVAREPGDEKAWRERLAE